jgi:hypothetical protein
MKPITFSCEGTLDIPPADIARQILDLAKWPAFNGFGIIPGIRGAEFEVQTPAIVGSKIRVTNTDGSGHVEEIVEWQPGSRVTLHMKDFSTPLARLATAFEEIWDFETVGNSTRVIRSFKLHAQSVLTRPLLWLISLFLKRAIDRHLRQMRQDASPGENPPCHLLT